MKPESMALVPAFVETTDGAFVCATHIVSLVDQGSESWLATTASQHTYRLSPYIVEQLLRGAARDTLSKPK